MIRSDYDQVVESIYDAALDPQHWRTAITLIKDKFYSLSAGFFVENNHQLQDFLFVGIEDQQVETYGEHFATINPWYTVPGLMCEGAVLTDGSLESLHKDKKAFLKTEMYQDWCRPQDFRHAMGGNILDNSGNKINFTFFRSRHAGHYTKQEISSYRSLSRHLLKAVELNARVQGSFSASALKEHALDSLRIGVVLLDSGKRAVFVNDYARTLLDLGQGLCLKESRLVATRHKAASLLANALEEACLSGCSATLNLPRTGKPPFSVTIVPETDGRSILGLPRKHAAVFICDPEDRDVAGADYLQARWQLTPLEARFCVHLIQGCTVTEIAQSMQLTRNTAEWYAKQIRGKLGVKRQSAAVALLLNDAGNMLRLRRS